MMAQESTKKGAGRRTAGDADELAALRKRRAELDARDVERRRQEDEALKRFASAAAKARKAREAGEAKAADLERRAADARQKAEAVAAEQDGEQAAALLQLHELGRNAEDLSLLTEIPVKRVRAMINAAKSEAAAAPKERPVEKPQPKAAPKPAAAVETASTSSTVPAAAPNS